ncbi:MAG: GntR family transcriptional regulator, partial [Cytophagales bacterium]|nr:GntR family transcriptional regulator [Armatimonadota bacterium]
MSASKETNPISPSVQHVVAVIGQKIRSGEYKGGQWLPSERLLAEEFTVSRIIIREAVKRIEDSGLIVRSAHCRPVVRSGDPGGTRTPLPRRRNIALLIWPYRSWPGSTLIVQGIQQAVNQDDFRLVLETASGETSEEIHTSEARFLERLCQDQDIEGLILWHLGGTQNQAALQSVRDAGVSLVFIDRLPPSGFDADYVGVDNVRAAEQAVRHLLSLGHQRIAHITNLDHASTVMERRLGYEQALRRAGIAPDPDLM